MQSWAGWLVPESWAERMWQGFPPVENQPPVAQHFNDSDPRPFASAGIVAVHIQRRLNIGLLMPVAEFNRV